MRILETPRTHLREWSVSDFDALRAICADDEFMRHMAKGSALTDEEVGERLSGFINHQIQHGFTYWAVVLKKSGEVIGHAGLKWMPDRPEIEIGYGLRRDMWGKGLATETSRVCLAYGFEQRAFDRIIALAAHENTASQRVLEKLGMLRDGVTQCRGREWELYAMSRDEWQREVPS